MGTRASTARHSDSTATATCASATPTLCPTSSRPSNASGLCRTAGRSHPSFLGGSQPFEARSCYLETTVNHEDTKITKASIRFGDRPATSDYWVNLRWPQMGEFGWPPGCSMTLLAWRGLMPVASDNQSSQSRSVERNAARIRSRIVIAPFRPPSTRELHRGVEEDREERHRPIDIQGHACK